MQDSEEFNDFEKYIYVGFQDLGYIFWQFASFFKVHDITKTSIDIVGKKCVVFEEKIKYAKICPKISYFTGLRMSPCLVAAWN